MEAFSAKHSGAFSFSPHGSLLGRWPVKQQVLDFSTAFFLPLLWCFSSLYPTPVLSSTRKGPLFHRFLPLFLIKTPLFSLDFLLCRTIIKTEQLNEMSSGQGENPDRRYSPRLAERPLTRCDSGTDSDVSSRMRSLDGRRCADTRSFLLRTRRHGLSGVTNKKGVFCYV